MIHFLRCLTVTVLALSILASTAFADDEKKPDIRHYRNNVDIKNFSETLGEQLDALDNKENLRVRCHVAVTPAQFEELGSWEWITSLLVDGDKQVVSLDPLSNLTNLKSLSLTRFPSSQEQRLDATPLGKLHNLDSLSILSTPLKNWDALANCTKLEYLNFHMSRVESLEFLRSTPEVKALDLYGYKHTFPDYQPVAMLEKLEHLDIYMNKQAVDEKLAVLNKLTTLKSFKMANCRKVTTLDFLENCKDLEELRATWAKKLTNIDTLKDLPNLRKIDLTDAPIDDLSPLNGKKKLKEIDIGGTKVEDLSALIECDALETVRIDETSIADLSPLHKLPNLSRIVISPTVPQAEIDALKEAVPKVRIDIRE